MDASREEHVFVLRIWKEPPPARVGWRATITDLKSGCKVAATELRDIADFIRLRISPSPDGPP
ncbi:MAG TPA: hypothetical protein VKR56_05705 [Candidatus Cybelea sp.]|nr:hypothetical protein [Candidatus Cybelea sp.]